MISLNAQGSAVRIVIRIPIQRGEQRI